MLDWIVSGTTIHENLEFECDLYPWYNRFNYLNEYLPEDVTSCGLLEGCQVFGKGKSAIRVKAEVLSV